MVISFVEPEHKIQWCQWWNSKPLIQKSFKFPLVDTSNLDFIYWLHKTTFWAHVIILWHVYFFLIFSFILQRFDMVNFVQACNWNKLLGGISMNWRSTCKSQLVSQMNFNMWCHWMTTTKRNLVLFHPTHCDYYPVWLHFN